MTRVERLARLDRERKQRAALALRKPMEEGFYDEALRAQDPETRIQFAEIAVPLVKDFDHILDLGCGSGVASSMLLDAGHQVTALDFSVTACELTKDKAGGAKVVKHDLRSGLPFHADAAIILQVLEHIADDVGALKDALTAAPFVLASVPRGEALASPDHLRTYSEELIRARFGALGVLRFHGEHARMIVFSIGRADPRGQRISQYWQSSSLSKPFFAPFVARCGFGPYVDPDAPLLVFGCYVAKDLQVVQKHRGLVVMLWGGTDILNHGHRSVFKKKNIRHIALSKFIAADLKRFKLRGVRLSLPLVDLGDLDPAPLGDAVYVYLPLGGGAKHGRTLVNAVARRVRDIEFIMNIKCDLGPKELRAAYRRSFMSLRLTPHDGMACSVIELGLMGRRSVYNGDPPCAIPWKGGDDIVRSIRAEAERRGKGRRKLDALRAVSTATKDFIHTSEDWLWLKFWDGVP